MADALDLGSSTERCGGSSPPSDTRVPEKISGTFVLGTVPENVRLFRPLYPFYPPGRWWVTFGSRRGTERTGYMPLIMMNVPSWSGLVGCG